MADWDVVSQTPLSATSPGAAPATAPPAAGGGWNVVDQSPVKPAFGSDDYINYISQKHGASPDYVRGLVESPTPGQVLSGFPIAGAAVPAIGAAASAAAYPLTGAGAGGTSYGERYTKDRALQDEIAGDFERENPRTTMAAHGLGAGLGIAATMGASGAVATGSVGARLLGITEGGLARQMGAGIVSGGILTPADEGAHQFASGQFDPKALGLAAGLGAAGGAAGPLVFRGLGAVGQAVPRMFGRGPAAAGPQNLTNVAGVDVPLTQGQATGDFTTQQFEQGAARGQLGPAAQRVADEFINAPGGQAASIEQARANIGRSFDPSGQQVVDTPGGAGEMVGEAVRNAAAASRANYDALYTRFRDLPGEIHAAAFEGIGPRIKAALSMQRDPIIVDDVTTPIASRALQDIDNNISQLRIQNRADPYGQPNPEEITGINLQGVDQARKRLNYFARATQPGTADQHAMRGIIDQFDNQVEGAISDGLFTGDDRALAALQQARAAYAQHKQLFTRQPADADVGNTMEKIVGRNGGEGATPTEIANWLYGAGKVGASGLSYRLAGRMQDLLGGTPAWSAIRQGLWSRLTQATEGTTQPEAEAVAGRINEFLNGTGAPTAQRMFTPQERTLMQQYANLQQQLIPRAGTVNYSGSSGGIAMILRHTARALGAMLGGAVSPFGGHAAGAIAGGHAAEALGQRGMAGQVARSYYQSPAQTAAEDQFMRQMGRYGAGASRSLGFQAVDSLQSQPTAGP